MKRISMFIAVVMLGTGCTSKALVIKSCSDGQCAEGPVRGEAFHDAIGLGTVYFDFDEANLRTDTREMLKSNAELLTSNPDREVLVEGHCDERGSSEYNLGLGQLRAKAIRDYYMLLGLNGSMIGTISYGKEQPICEEHEESCWSKNRRGETKIR